MHIIILLLAILPMIYKLSFWLYTIQLKEYRWDRFKEYLYTRQGKKAIGNFWIVFEIPVFFLTILILYNQNMFFGIVTYILFYLLVFENIFVLGKIFRKKLIKPKITQRVLILILLFIIGGSIDLFFFQYLDLWLYFYSYILIVFLSIPFLLFFYIYIANPIINYKKNKIIKKAVKKSKDINDIIKIGITGSYGKSSVKEFLYSILKNEGNTLKTPKNINTELGVSRLIIDKLSNDYDYFIAEMGAYKIGEIETLGDIVNHKYGFLTAIGNQHLGLFGNIENTKKAKFEISKKVLENNGVLYINYDDKNISSIKLPSNLQIVKYGLNKDCNAFSDNIKFENNLTTFDFHYGNNTYYFKTNLVGNHNILNITGVLAFCFDNNISYEKLKKYMLNITSPDNTQIIIKNNTNIIIDDSHNLSEQGLLSGISLLDLYKQTKIVVIDDILELGKESSIIHQKLGFNIAKNYNIDKILLCGINYKNDIKSGLIKGGFNEDNFINSLKNIKDSVILLEGKNSKKYLNNLKSDV